MKEKKVSTLRRPAQLADLQRALCVPTYNLTCIHKNWIGKHAAGVSQNAASITAANAVARGVATD